MDPLDCSDVNLTHTFVPSSEESAELTSSYDASYIEALQDKRPIRKRSKNDAEELEESDVEVQESGGKKKILETEGEKRDIEDEEVQSTENDRRSSVQSSEDKQESDSPSSDETGSPSVQNASTKKSSEEKGSPSVQDMSDKESSEEKGSPSVQYTPTKESSEVKETPSVQDTSDKESSEEKGSPSVQYTTTKESSEEKEPPSVQDMSDNESSEEQGSSSVQNTPTKKSSEEKGTPSVQDTSDKESSERNESPSVQDTSTKESSEGKGTPSVHDTSDKESSEGKESPSVQDMSDNESSEEKGSPSVQITPTKKSSEEKGTPSVQDTSDKESSEGNESPSAQDMSDKESSEEKGSPSVQNTPTKKSPEEKGTPSVQNTPTNESSEEKESASIQDTSDKESSEEKESASIQDMSDKESSEAKGSPSVQDVSDKESSEGNEPPSVQDMSDNESSEEKGSPSVQNTPIKESSEEKGSPSVQNTPIKESSEEKGTPSVQNTPTKESSEGKESPSVQDTPDQQESNVQGSDKTEESDIQVPEDRQESNVDIDQGIQDADDYHGLPIFERLMNLASGDTAESVKSIVEDWITMYTDDQETAEQQFVELLLHCIGYHKKTINWNDWKKSALTFLIAVMPKIQQIGANESVFRKNSKEYDVNFQEIFGQFIQCLEQELFINRNTSFDAFLLLIVARFGNAASLLTFKLVGTHIILNWYAAILKIISDLNKNKTNHLHRLKNMKDNPKLKHAYTENKRQIKEIIKDQNEIKILADKLAKYILNVYFWDTAEEIQLLCLKHWQILIQRHPELMCSPREFDNTVNHIAHSNTTIRSLGLKVSLTYIKVLATEDKTAATQFYSQLKPYLSRTWLDTDNNQVILATLNIYSKAFDLWIEENENLFSPEERNLIFLTVLFKDKTISTLAGTLINKELQRNSRHDPKNYIIQLISYLGKEPFESKIPYIVNALNYKPQNWKMLISFLMDDDLQLEHCYGLQEIVSLTELTISLVRKACTGTAFLSKDPTKEVIGFEKERERVTYSFIKCMPNLIKKHRDDGRKISNLVSICYYFINVNGVTNGTNECKAIVNSIQEALEYVRHPLGLKNCFQVLKSLSMVHDEVLASCEIFVEKIEIDANKSLETSWSEGSPQEAAHHLLLLTHASSQFKINWMPRLLVFLENLAKSQIDTTLEMTAVHCIKSTFLMLYRFEPLDDDELVEERKKCMKLVLAILKKENATDNVRVASFITICKYYEMCDMKLPGKTQNGLVGFLTYCVNKALESKPQNAETLENATKILKRVCVSPVEHFVFESCVQNLLNILMPVEELPGIEFFQNIIYQALIQVTEKYTSRILDYLAVYFDENVVRADDALNSLKQLKKTAQKLCSLMTPTRIQRLDQDEVFHFHHEGIIYATSNEDGSCYAFLDILEKFAKFLSKENCKKIKQELESKTESLDNANNFVKNYHRALLQQEKRLSELEKRMPVKTYRKPKIPKEKKSPCPPQPPTSVISESSQLPQTSQKPNSPHKERSPEVQVPQTTKSKVTKRKEDLQKSAEKKQKLTEHDSSIEDIEKASTSSPELSTKSPSTSNNQTSPVSTISSHGADSSTLKAPLEKSKISLISTRTVTRSSTMTEHCTSSDATNESDADQSLQS